MKPTPVCCFGEVLIDFLQDKAQPGLFHRFAGGAPANVAVAVAKLGGQSKFIGMLGKDMFGDFLQQELQSYGVDCSAVRQTMDAKTALAFVALNDQGDRSFSFYRPPAADLLYKVEHCPTDLWQDKGILHLCSNSLTEPDIAQTSFALVRLAQQHGWLVSVDANLRHNLWAEGKASIELVTQLLEMADLVKLSEDELTYLAGEQSTEHWLQHILEFRPSWLVVTAGAEQVQSYSKTDSFSVAVTAVPVLDTTAAGDAFVGAWLFQAAQLLDSGCSVADLLMQKELQQQVIRKAIKAGSLTCQKFGAFAALPTASEWN
ncbi:sugar kinase, ribokinase [Rheinheimera sp. A13L]|uniref:carbohydrate kinase family protein n=1 Tax=Rheinheimera sp. A13L TaxID=506534 RepID=UPI0002124CBD|nr:carbohydrate kinase [Rheinheimera sp. A13L]EGM76172.1 sugar kinase, ribokinase [Rheinheimera sp. A13L]